MRQAGPRDRSAGFQTCRIAGFQTRRRNPIPRPADLEVGDKAGSETCATAPPLPYNAFVTWKSTQGVLADGRASDALESLIRASGAIPERADLLPFRGPPGCPIRHCLKPPRGALLPEILGQDSPPLVVRPATADFQITPREAFSDKSALTNERDGAQVSRLDVCLQPVEFELPKSMAEHEQHAIAH